MPATNPKSDTKNDPRIAGSKTLEANTCAGLLHAGHFRIFFNFNRLEIIENLLLHNVHFAI